MTISKFVMDESHIIPVCNKCKHYMSGRRCRAFKMIPDIILEGKNNHNKPIPGQDNNIVFEEKKENA